jgi:hypothetical protein
MYWSFIHSLTHSSINPFIHPSVIALAISRLTTASRQSVAMMTVMHAHCARFLNHDVYQPQHTDVGSPHMGASLTMTASEFMHKLTIEAQLGLGMETTKPSSIPAIQALLQQSAREVVFDRSSQAWLYGGMACKYLPVKTILNPVHTPFKRILTCF